ncbi:hypothetical protein EYR40_006911 [Pleurotus pulmonarius]|nr:hypothetical protein EYR36_003811 [Pleurotus pulmonarius]KAF4598551.1 hypothetical protein EYR38_006955 [Pleurotus pulmonarius]KAF4599809.1 hypothetical protein EYR40_006911 [Pleurotus pulmonarius]
MSPDKALPVYTPPPRPPPTPHSAKFRRLLATLLLSTLALSLSAYNLWSTEQDRTLVKPPLHSKEILDQCRALELEPGPPADFHLRKASDRFVPGTKPVLIKNATIWTGETSGYEVIKGDLLLDKGLIQSIGDVGEDVILKYKELDIVDVAGSWVTPGIVDLHSHLGVLSSPSLRGSSDGNSRKGLVQPWLRSLDGLNTHDEAYKLSISGGVTTVNVLPGSANSIGGQAFTIKLRPTKERSASSMLLEPPFTLNGTEFDPSVPPRWRQMKHACGENPSRVYSDTRMDTIWALRQGYETARKIKVSQDEFCAKAQAGLWNELGDFPEDLQWEALVDVQNHCYEAVDLDGIVRLTNEFKFPIAAFHHAHETYLVPDLLKKAYGRPPAVAIFATNGRYKREAFRGSEFAARILADNGLNVVMKSDHPVLDSRYLVYEAQQAHYYGLPRNLALAAVTTTPASTMGMDHRIGFIKSGYDADVVVWDSHPLWLGATPKQVYIDGIPQLDDPQTLEKPSSFQSPPETPNFDKERADAIKYEGLPPLVPSKAKSDVVIFSNVSSLFVKSSGTIKQVFVTSAFGERGVVVVKGGKLICSGASSSCQKSIQAFDQSSETIDVEGGSIAPGLLTFGSPLGLQEIAGEATTSDGVVGDPLGSGLPALVGGEGAVIRAADGLQFSTRDALIAYRAGVTSAVVSPKSSGFLSGLGVAFSVGASHGLESGAIQKPITALHVAITHASSVSVSELGERAKAVVNGELPLVVAVDSADAMASLIKLKAEIEAQTETPIRVTFSGANEAHLIAEEIAAANIGVILVQYRPFPSTWEKKRILPGPPISRLTSVTTLLAANVTVGLGVEEAWNARNTRFEIGWANLDAQGDLTKADAIALGSVNLEKLLGIDEGSANNDLVVTKTGSIMDFEAKVTGVISASKDAVYLL